ncbi:MAG: hypothetical protein ACM3JI_00645 [Anaerolineae bacterium]
MAQDKSHQELTVMEAVDNLSSMAEIVPKDIENQNVEEKYLEAFGVRSMEIDWTDQAHLAENREKVKATFRVLHSYLRNLYENNRTELAELDTQKGVQAIMVLAGEAAQKLDKYTVLFKEAQGGSITELPEYKDLQQFYLTKIMKKFQEALETEEAWQAEWGGLQEDVLDIKKRGLRDLETVRRDKEYELFYVRKENGSPFFNRNLLRHISLVGHFDESVIEKGADDPLLRIKMILDRELHIAARQLLKLVAPHVDEFYKEAMRYKNEEFVASLSKALIALMLTANPRNLLQNVSGKSCLSYYADFHLYLRSALRSEDYQKFVAAPNFFSAAKSSMISSESFIGSERFSHILLNLSHALCCFFFMRIEKREEAIQFISRLIQKGGGELPSSKEGVHQSPLAIWNTLLDEDQHLRYLLKKHPSGPLLKTLALFRQDDEFYGFDPLAQQNLPHQLFSFSYEDAHVTCLRLPCPTMQEFINEAEVVDEFRGFLRSLQSDLKSQKHLLINLQDRTSWQEHARSIALEVLQKDAEFSKNLIVVTLPKSTDFYMQTDIYHDVTNADHFKGQLQEQVKSAEECGFYFPASLSGTDFSTFVYEAIERIHALFFASKKILSRKNRLDFIEIFYHFFVLKIIEMTKPDTISFTCKDALDTGAAASAGFFAFLKLMSSGFSSFSKEDKELLLWMLYSPALMVRERAIDLQRLSRIVSCLAVIHAEVEAKGKEPSEKLSSLYREPLFDQLKVLPVRPLA